MTMAIKSLKEFQTEFNQARIEKHKQELKFRDEYKAGEQERVVNNILNSLNSQINRHIENVSLEPVSAREYSHPFDCITKDDIHQVVTSALSQIESELINAGYEFEADIQESGQGYELTTTIILAPEINNECNKFIEQESIKLVTVGAILCALMSE